MVDNEQPRFIDKPFGLEDRCESVYTLHDGTLVMPVMGDSTQLPVVVRLHPPYTTRRAEFSYTQPRIPPLVPPPGDTTANGVASSSGVGDTYLGGTLGVHAPIQNANGDLVYKVTGGYNFLVANDVRTYGKVRFDAHGYLSKVDFLGHMKAEPVDVIFGSDELPEWTSPYFDLNKLASSRILG